MRDSWTAHGLWGLLDLAGIQWVQDYPGVITVQCPEGRLIVNQASPDKPRAGGARRPFPQLRLTLLRDSVPFEMIKGIACLAL